MFCRHWHFLLERMTMSLKIITDHVSPNFGDRAALRPEGAAPFMVILHYTGMQTGQAALARLCDPAAEVSAHYVIGEDGAVYRLVEDDKRAWHAGRSCWDGLSDINSASIGIEIVNKGHEFGYTTFPANQINSLLDLLEVLGEKYMVRADRILGHSDIAPERKTDPGELFPWAALAARGFGLWPAVSAMDLEAAADLRGDADALHGLLAELGYDPSVDFACLSVAFFRHFSSEKFESGCCVSLEWSAEDVARLLALIRQKNDLACAMPAV